MIVRALVRERVSDYSVGALEPLAVFGAGYAIGVHAWAALVLSAVVAFVGRIVRNGYDDSFNDEVGS